MKTQVRSHKSGRILLALLLVLAILAPFIPAPHPAEAACPAPGSGFAGAYNMMHDATMWTIPMVKNTSQGTHGNEGMFLAVANSSCP